jgi:hypothetical protein
MADALSAETKDAVIAEVLGAERSTNPYNATKKIQLPEWMR